MFYYATIYYYLLQLIIFPICQRAFLYNRFEDVLDLNQLIHLFESHQITINLKNLKWRISESNRWPSACKADALANWANPPERINQLANC